MNTMEILAHMLPFGYEETLWFAAGLAAGLTPAFLLVLLIALKNRER